jgi:hypothetical protein
MQKMCEKAAKNSFKLQFMTIDHGMMYNKAKKKAVKGLMMTFAYRFDCHLFKGTVRPDWI